MLFGIVPVIIKFIVKINGEYQRRETGMVTLKEIAKECNVSATTVSNILNGKNNVSEETRKRVMEVVQLRGYQPNYIAQGLRNRRTKMIGIIAEDVAQFSTPVIMEGIMEYFEEAGYRTMIENLRLYARWGDSWYEDEGAYRSVLEPALQELISIKVDGLIYIAGHARILRSFSGETAIPSVMVYAYTDSPRVPSVVIDDEQGAYDMTKYLISMGHQRIAVLGGREDNIHTQKRLKGYQRALFESRLLYNPEWVFYGNWQKDSGYEAAEKLYRTGATAIFCMSDRMAGGVYEYFYENGIRVGEDISVAGFDNQEMAEFFSPGLTTMELNLRHIGYEAGKLMIDRLAEGKKEERADAGQALELYIPCNFIERRSVKRV